MEHGLSTKNSGKWNLVRKIIIYIIIIFTILVCALFAFLANFGFNLTP